MTQFRELFLKGMPVTEPKIRSSSPADDSAMNAGQKNSSPVIVAPVPISPNMLGTQQPQQQPAQSGEVVTRFSYASIDIEKLGQMMGRYNILTLGAAIFELQLRYRQDELTWHMDMPENGVQAFELDAYPFNVDFSITLHNGRKFPFPQPPVVNMDNITLREFWLKNSSNIHQFVNQLTASLNQKSTAAEVMQSFVTYLRTWDASLAGTSMKLLTDYGVFDGAEISHALGTLLPELGVDISTIFGSFRGVWDFSGELRQLRATCLLDHKNYRSDEEILSSIGCPATFPTPAAVHDHDPEHDSIHQGYIFAYIIRHNTLTKLHMLRAAYCNSPEYLQRYLGRGVHVNSVREYKTGNTLLHVAVEQGHLTFVKYLLYVLDVDCTAVDAKNHTSLEKALAQTENTRGVTGHRLKQRFEIVELLEHALAHGGRNIPPERVATTTSSTSPIEEASPADGN